MSSSLASVTDTLKSAASTATEAASAAATTVTSTVSGAATAVQSSVVGSTATETEDVAKPDETPLSPSDAAASLEKGIKGRPDKKDLVDRNILKDTNVAPALHKAQAELQKAQLENLLEQKLENRPAAEELVKEGILTVDEVPPSA